MDTLIRLIHPDVAEALRTDPKQVVELTEELHPADLAELAMMLDDELAVVLMHVLPLETGARLLEALDPSRRVVLFRHLVAKDAKGAVARLEAMAPDERADLIGELPDEMRGQLLGKMEQEESRDVRQLLMYPEGTAGAIMTTNFVALAVDQTVARAIEDVKRSAEEMETIYEAYAVDPHGTLLGVVSLRDLVVAPSQKSIQEIMQPNVIAVFVDQDQEEVARVIAKYDLLAVPVMDPQRRIVGIVTVDDVVDVLEEEATEDAQKMGAVSPLEDSYFATPFWEFVKKRASWLVILFLGELATGNTLKHFTDEFSTVVTLVWFVPLILSSGGNAGSQSAALMIRSLATGEVRQRDWLRVMWREALMGLALGAILCTVGLARVFLWKATRSLAMAMTITLALVCVVTSGTVIGSALPLILKRLGLDPAVSSTPFIASLQDVTGLFIYFELARVFLFK